MTPFSGFIILLGATFLSIIKDASTHDVSGFIPCPDDADDSGWVLGDIPPYYCYQLTPNKQTWEDTKQHCISQGAQLVSVKNAEENNFVRRFLDVVPDELGIWLGIFSNLPLSNPLRIGYKLLETNYEPTYTNWAPHEPNDWQYTGESVVEMWKEGTWNDNKPSSLRYGVCRKFMTLRTICGVFLPDNIWHNGPANSNSCFQAILVAQNKSSAERACKDKGGYLASIHSRAEEKFVTKMAAVGLGLKPVWAGLKYEGLNWSDESEDVVSIEGKGKCVVFDAKKTAFKFIDCDKDNVALCKKTVPPSKDFTKCPGEPDGSPWILGPNKNNCYRVTDNEQDWESAKQFCQSEGATLSIITSHAENDLALSLTNNNVKSLWIGTHYVNDQFEYVDGSPLQFTDKWFSSPNPLYNEPNGRKDPGAENCVKLIGINNGAAAGYWKDDDCSKKAYGVCQKDAP